MWCLIRSSYSGSELLSLLSSQSSYIEFDLMSISSLYPFSANFHPKCIYLVMSKIEKWKIFFSPILCKEGWSSHRGICMSSIQGSIPISTMGYLHGLRVSLPTLCLNLLSLQFRYYCSIAQRNCEGKIIRFILRQKGSGGDVGINLLPRTHVTCCH